MFESKLNLLVWAFLPCTLVSQTIYEAHTNNLFCMAIGIHFSPDNSQMVFLLPTSAMIIKRNGNIYNETVQALPIDTWPIFAEFTPDGQFLYLVEEGGIGQVHQKNSSDLWVKKL